MAKKLTTEEFILKAKEIHGDKYTYNKVKYKNYSTKVGICCPKHGMFYQVPSSHLKGSGCPKCRASKGELLIKDLLESSEITFEYQKIIEYNGIKMRVDFYLEMNDKKIYYRIQRLVALLSS